MKLLTAGESHGKTLIGIIEGLPSNLKIDIDEINEYLSLRQKGYGRGARQKIESDKVEILSGVRNLLTLGSPLSFGVENLDYKNWQAYMAAECCDITQKQLTAVRPGHADLAGVTKYEQDDARNILERASARETAIRVVAGTIARQYLQNLGVQILGYVKSICGIEDSNTYEFEQLKRAKDEPLFMLDNAVQKAAMEKIDQLKLNGDTCGGIVEIRVKGLKSGFGSCMSYTEKLDGILCGTLMGVQSVKGVEIGLGFDATRSVGSKVHDEIFYNNGYYRTTNNAGGIEGGMSNGEEIVLKVALKPIPTLTRGLRTVDIKTKKEALSAPERSDTCAVPAAEIVLESVVAFTLAQVISKRLGGDTMRQIIERYKDLP